MTSISYQDIDTVLVPWAQTKRLHFVTTAKDEETRSAVIVDQRGDEYDLWAVPDYNDRNELVLVGCALRGRGSKKHTFYRERKNYMFSLTVPIPELSSALNQALAQIQQWSDDAIGSA